MPRPVLHLRVRPTKDDVKAGRVCHDQEKPFFIKHEADGYCHHLVRDTLKCGLWADRPGRCRNYDYRDDDDDNWPLSICSLTQRPA